MLSSMLPHESMTSLAFQFGSGAADATSGLFGVLFSVWCVVIVGQFALFILALIQVLQRDMPNDAKILWACITWFVPIVGPILWWTIGSKQNPPGEGKRMHGGSALRDQYED